MEPNRLIKDENGKVVSILIHDIEFTLQDIYNRPALHEVYHKLIKEDNE